MNNNKNTSRLTDSGIRNEALDKTKWLSSFSQVNIIEINASARTVRKKKKKEDEIIKWN